MMLISLKDYAKNNNITYEAVRQQVKRYKKELGSHVIIDGRQQFLDDDAVAFLDDKRQKNPVTIIQQSKDDAIEQLRQDKENLLVKVAAQADKISELEGWKADHAVAIAESNHRQMLLEERKERIDALEAKNADLSHERDEYKDKVAETSKSLQKVTDELTAIKSKWYYKWFAGKKL